jgi:hypothetical protein
VRIGRSRGVRRFTAEVMADNHAMLKVFHKGQAPVQSVLEEGVYRLTILLAPKAEGAADPRTGAPGRGLLK